MTNSGTIAVDFDATLSVYHGWTGELGAPVPSMVRRIQRWVRMGYTVVIFTARANRPEEVQKIKAWCLEHLGYELDVTNIKRPDFVEMWDDRAVQVIPNTGVPVGQPRIP